MRFVYFDIDTLRADHLGCYGYHRNTSQNIDQVASEGVRFENCFNSDAPCLPSRAGMFMGRHGIHTGVINHGGTDADPMPEGPQRGFKNSPRFHHWPMVMKLAGKYTVSVSPYPERHSAWWFNAGFRETYNPGKSGGERADEVFPYALDWLERNGSKDNWFLHINCWDPHTPYRTPMEYGNPFENDPPPDWMTDEIIARDLASYGPNSPNEVACWRGLDEIGEFPRLPKQMKNVADFRRWIDGYDTGIHYADFYVGKVLDLLKKLGIYDETAILISSDHGENQGELGIYGDHHTADSITSRVPCILKWPGVAPGVRQGLHYQSDVAAMTLELWDMKVPGAWDGRSFAEAFRQGRDAGREYLVVSQNCWSCQRSARWDNWLLMRTYHTCYHPFPGVMLFDVAADSHLQHNLAEKRPDVVDHGLAVIERWHSEMMQTSQYEIDPMWRVIREGGPYHGRNVLPAYLARLRATGRAHHAEFLEKQGGRPIDE